MDSEFKKLLAGESWAEHGTRADMDDPNWQPIIDRGQGYPAAFSTDTAPTRARINQVFRELSGGAKELVWGVSPYDPEVDYPAGAVTNVSGRLYYAKQRHLPSSPVSPLDLNQTTWEGIGGRGASERTVPATIEASQIFIDSSRGDQFIPWYYVSDNGGHPITQAQIRYDKTPSFSSPYNNIYSQIPTSPGDFYISGSNVYIYWLGGADTSLTKFNANPGVHISFERTDTFSRVEGIISAVQEQSGGSTRYTLSNISTSGATFDVVNTPVRVRLFSSSTRSFEWTNTTTGVMTRSVTPGVAISIPGQDSYAYYVSIRTRNLLGWSQWSSAKQVRSSILGPGPVFTTTAQPSGVAGILNVSWLEPDIRGLPIFGYEVAWRTGAQSYSTSTRRQVVSRLTRQTSINVGNSTSVFFVRVRAISPIRSISSGWNEASAIAAATLNPPNSPAISTEAVSPTSMRAWLSAALHNGGRDVTAYQWRHRKVASPAGAWTTENTTASPSLLLPDLDRGASYEFSLRAYNGVNDTDNDPTTGGLGWSAWSSSKSQTPFNPELPDAPVFSVGSSETVVPNFVKGVVSFSLGDLTKSEVTKDRIIQTAVRWRDASNANAAWIEESSASTAGVNDNRFGIPQIFPTSGNIRIGRDLAVSARWRNPSGWSDWAPSQTLNAIVAPSGNLTLNSSAFTIRENESAVLTIRLSRAPVSDAVVALSVDNADVTLSASSLTFTEANWNTDQSVTISAARDSDSADDIANITLSVSGGLDVSDDTVVVTVKEALEMAVSGDIITPEGSNAYFAFGLTAQPPSPVQVVIGNPTDSAVNITPRSLSFSPSNWTRCQIASVSNVADQDQLDETAQVPITVSGGINETISRQVIVADNVENATNIIRTGHASVAIGETSDPIGLRLSRAPEQAFHLDIVPLRPHLTVSPTSLSYTLANWNTNQNFTVTAASHSPNNGFDFIMLRPRNVPDVAPNFVQVGITHPIITDASYSVPEGNYIDASVLLHSQPSSNVIITPSSDNSDLTFLPASLTFTSSNWSTSQPLRISAAVDSDIDNETQPVTLSSTGGLTTTVDVPTSVLESNNRIDLSSQAITIAPNSSGTSEFSLLNIASNDIAVTIRALSGSDVTVSPSSFTVSAGSDGTRTLTFTRSSGTGASRFAVRATSSNSSVSIAIAYIDIS